MQQKLALVISYSLIQRKNPTCAGPLNVRGPIWQNRSNRLKTGPGYNKAVTLQRWLRYRMRKNNQSLQVMHFLMICVPSSLKNVRTAFIGRVARTAATSIRILWVTGPLLYQPSSPSNHNHSHKSIIITFNAPSDALLHHHCRNEQLTKSVFIACITISEELLQESFIHSASLGLS